jgi:hypothetical protein
MDVVRGVAGQIGIAPRLLAMRSITSRFSVGVVFSISAMPRRGSSWPVTSHRC